MKTIRNASIVLILIGLFFLSCNRNKPVKVSRIDYSDTAYWYSCSDESHAADVFYVYPTVSTISYADNGSFWFTDIAIPTVR